MWPQFETRGKKQWDRRQQTTTNINILKYSHSIQRIQRDPKRSAKNHETEMARNIFNLINNNAYRIKQIIKSPISFN